MRFDVSHFINNEKMSKFQLKVIILCGIIAALDGFDTQSIAFVAPVISQEWGLESSAFGPIFGLGLLGMMIGSMLFGPLADRFGRKSMIVICLIIIGTFSLLTVSAASVTSLMVLRFLTGLGLGGAIPNILALTAEYSPKRVFNTTVTVMFCGFPLGAVIGGLTMSRIIPVYGWETVFYVGGLAPFLFIPILMLMLPESIRFLVGKGTSNSKIIWILNKIKPSSQWNESMQFSTEENRVNRMYVKHLFTNGLAKTTLLIWTIYFLNLLIFYSMVNWLPTILKTTGVPIEKAILSIAIFNLGGIVGGIIIGRLIDKRDKSKILTVMFGLAAIVIAAIGLLGSFASTLLFMVFLSGFFVMGSTLGVQALMTSVYTTSIRSTGVGWALGIGRIGAIVGPMAIGSLLSLHVPITLLFLVWAVPAVVAAVAMYFLRSPQHVN